MAFWHIQVLEKYRIAGLGLVDCFVAILTDCRPRSVLIDCILPKFGRRKKFGNVMVPAHFVSQAQTGQIIDICKKERPL